ncbi:hypothetical protein SteCoe_35696 [Stentor coeruleus]|uniref:AMP-dependent synthetase/ligase domain-containing protein n=1 Tax=Stentor coeruleus TaxID=5963 RepID=A0A1R2ARU7_9CILI|nr:hypothetical protein SteCoe_35696 [Stentor coeruleus]
MITRRLFSEFLALKKSEVHRDAVHFLAQQYRWSYKEVYRHSGAYAVGLLEMGLKPGDTISSWINCSEAPESYMVHLACYRAGIKILTLGSGEDLDKALNGSKAFVLSPWVDYNGQPRIDFLLKKVPQLLETPAGSLVKSSVSAKYFIQTGFSTIRGTYKLKSVPVYNGTFTEANTLSFTHKDSTVGDEEYKKFLGEVSGKVLNSGDIVVNSVTTKAPLSFATFLAGLNNKTITTSAIHDDPAAIVNKQNAKVLVITEDKIANIEGKCTVDKVVLGVNKKEDVDRVAKMLEGKGVKAKSIFPYHVGNLSYLG